MEDYGRAEKAQEVVGLFQTVFKTFLKDKDKIINALELPYSNAKLEATNNLIKVIKRNAFGFRNFENFKTRILIALNIKKEKNHVGPLQDITFHQSTTVDKEPTFLVDDLSYKILHKSRHLQVEVL